MAFWTPTPEWQGQDAFIIGGGHSLHGFDFSFLKGRNTIGCNDAFRLGEEVVKICHFGDESWFQKNQSELERFKGRIVSISPRLAHLEIHWLLKMDRVRDSLHTGHVLGWNYSTGASAINLAISLGAKRIYLLGFDLCCNSDGKSHWHSRRAKQTEQQAFDRFLRGFRNVQAGLLNFPDVTVFNVTDGVSKLHVFPRIDFIQFAEVLK